MKSPELTSRSGLTLLELLLALALLALIAAALVSTLGLGLRLNDRTSALSELHEPLAARRLLRSLLQSALPPDRVAPFEHGFYGDAEGFTFVSLAHRDLEPEAAALRVIVTADDGELALRIETIADDGPSRAVVSAVLTTSNEDIVISYYDRFADPPSWSESWELDERLPDLVRIEAAEGSTPDWADFAVAPGLGG